jgi:transcription elongation factor GreA
LRDEKIPANENAIGAAAALGDLSENAEWEMALQEKRNLTTRLAEMEGDALRARLLEDASLPEDKVCPGTAVRYRDLGAGDEHRIVILGPWDTDMGEDIVSYRAPLAQGLLGLSSGDQSRVDLPGGALDLEVLGIEPVDVQ